MSKYFFKLNNLNAKPDRILNILNRSRLVKLYFQPRDVLKRFLHCISSQTVESNLALREGRTDISDIQRHLFSGKLKPILMSKFTFPKNK